MIAGNAPRTPPTPLTPLTREAIGRQPPVAPWAINALKQWRHEEALGALENLGSPKTPVPLSSAEDQPAFLYSASRDQSSEASSDGGTPTWSELRKNRDLWHVGTHLVLRPRALIPRPSVSLHA